MMNKRIDGEYVVTEYDNGAVVRELNSSPPVPAPSLSVSDFLRRFTRQERIAIRQAKNTDPVIEDILHLINIAASETGTVRLDHPDLIEGANYLESEGFIAPGRAAQLLEK